jgi:hypothetical protein
MHFRDLELCLYPPDQPEGGTNAGSWNVPLLAIGWLEHGHPFDRGEVPESMRASLRAVMQTAWESNCFEGYMGQHFCSICAAAGRSSDKALRSSAINIFVPDEACVYVFPACIFHYIDEHGYQPPLAFCKAVASCERRSGRQYRSALIETNRGPIPVDDHDEFPATDPLPL